MSDIEEKLEAMRSEWYDSGETLLVHTSGSTGKPKPMWVEKRRMLNSARITCDFLGLKPGDTALLCMPLDYIAGKMMVVRSIERNLQLTAIKPSNHPLALTGNAAIDAFIERGFDFAAMVPSQVFCSLQVPEERQRLMKIRHLIIGGGAITPQLQALIDEATTSTTVYSTYGMTETLSHIALRRVNGDEATPWYTPFDSVSLSQDSDGCLIIDAPLVHDGLLHTNDIVEMHPDGRRFRVRGRRDNVICCGGIKLQIEEIEDAIRPFMHAPFAIVKRPDEKFGEIPVLLMEQTDMPHLQLHNPYYLPKQVHHVDKIPMTETGKVKRGADK